MADPITPLPVANQEFVDRQTLQLTTAWRNYLVALDGAVRNTNFGSLVVAPDDRMAQAGGVPINGLYQDGTGAVRVRLK